jgi:hypothetical protein
MPREDRIHKLIADPPWRPRCCGLFPEEVYLPGAAPLGPDAYNAVGMLTSLINKTSGGAVLSSYSSFAYDGVFNLTGLSSSVPGAPSQGGTQTFGYDAKDRLTADSSTRSGGYGFTVSYDRASTRFSLVEPLVIGR